MAAETSTLTYEMIAQGARARLRCINCGSDYPITEVVYHCTRCQDLLDVVYDYPSFEAAAVKRTWLERRRSFAPWDMSGVWRYREFLPFLPRLQDVVTYPEGNTPLLAASHSSAYCGIERLQFKHLGFNPTGSFKDYGMTAGVSQAKVLGMRAVACASTGNTSASLAAYAARAGMLAIVLIPEGQVSFGKLSQALDYGALTLQLRGDFDAAQALLLEIASELGIYVLNSVNPFRLEGQKTVMIEVLEQRGWRVPDRIIVPGGNLGNGSSYGKCLRELHDAGFIDRLPHLTLVQAQGAAPLYETVTSSNPEVLMRVHARTLATAIKIGSPVSWRKAKRALEWTDGWVTTVDEQEIADAKAVIGRDGIGCEPASATTLAGLRRLMREGTDEHMRPDEDVVAILTGNVLKDPDYTVRYHTGELYEEFVTETRVVRESGHLEPHYANQPIPVEARREELVAVIREHLTDL